jgi:hypothetical protein
MTAHIGGVPFEETLPALAPLVCAFAVFGRARLSALRRSRRGLRRSAS